MKRTKLQGSSGLGGARGLTIGGVGDRSGPIAPKWVRLKRMARQAKKDNQPDVAAKLYGAYASEKLNSPTIGTEAYRKAEGAMQGQANQWADRRNKLMGMYYDYMEKKMKRDQDRWTKEDDKKGPWKMREQ